MRRNFLLTVLRLHRLRRNFFGSMLPLLRYRIIRAEYCTGTYRVPVPGKLVRKKQRAIYVGTVGGAAAAAVR